MSTHAVMLEMRRKKTSHIFHLIFSVLTGGLWIVIWLLCALSNSLENRKLDKQIDRILLAEAGSQFNRS